ncbi:MAG: iron transporter [Agathobacter sp.]
MKRKFELTICGIICAGMALAGCGSNAKQPGTELAAVSSEEQSQETIDDQQTKAELPDGEYTAEFKTDSSMFHVSEACDGKGKLTVKDGVMTIHISLTSKKIVNLFPGTAEEAGKDGAILLNPIVDTVTYSDGMTEEVNGFDVPVPALNQEFDLALLGTKGVWYDHKVSVTDPMPEDGTYSVDLTFEGGSGKAKIESPATLKVAEGKATARVTWSSPNYDYMLVDDQKYLPVNTEGNSVFEIPVAVFDQPMTVIGDTVAMSTPHEVEYTLTFHSDTLSNIE